MQKKTNEKIDNEDKSGLMRDYNIFMAMVDKIGHDKRGNPIFKRDKYGNEILIPEDSDVIEIDVSSEGTKTAKAQSKSKVRDDQTILVPKIFQEWKEQEGIVW